MATATAKEETIVKKIITLTISEEEAQALRTLIGGHVWFLERNKELTRIYHAITPYTDTNYLLDTLKGQSAISLKSGGINKV